MKIEMEIKTNKHDRFELREVFKASATVAVVEMGASHSDAARIAVSSHG